MRDAGGEVVLTGGAAKGLLAGTLLCEKHLFLQLIRNRVKSVTIYEEKYQKVDRPSGNQKLEAAAKDMVGGADKEDRECPDEILATGEEIPERIGGGESGNDGDALDRGGNGWDVGGAGVGERCVAIGNGVSPGGNCGGDVQLERDDRGNEDIVKRGGDSCWAIGCGQLAGCSILGNAGSFRSIDGINVIPSEKGDSRDGVGEKMKKRGRPRGSKTRRRGGEVVGHSEEDTGGNGAGNDRNGCNAGGDDVIVLKKRKIGRSKGSKTRRQVTDGNIVELLITKKSDSEVAGAEEIRGLPDGIGSGREITVERRKLGRPKGSKNRRRIPDGELHGGAGGSVANDDLEGNQWHSGAFHGGMGGEGWRQGRGRPKGWKKRRRKGQVFYGGNILPLGGVRKRGRKRKIIDGEELWGLIGLKRGRKGGIFDGKQLKGSSHEARIDDLVAELQSFAPCSGAVLAEYIRKKYDSITHVPSLQVQKQPDLAKMVGFLATLKNVVPYRGGALAEYFMYRKWRSSIAALEYLAPHRGVVLAEYFLYRQRSSSIPYDDVYKCELDEAPLDESIQGIAVNEGASLSEGIGVGEGPTNGGIHMWSGGGAGGNNGGKLGAKEFLGGFGEFARQKDGGYGFSRLKNKCRRLKGLNNGEEIGIWSGEFGKESDHQKEIQGCSSESGLQNDGDKMANLKSKCGRPNSSEDWVKDLNQSDRAICRIDGRGHSISSEGKCGWPEVSENKRTILAAEQDGIIPFEVTGWNDVGYETEGLENNKSSLIVIEDLVVPVKVLGSNEKPNEIVKQKAKRGRPKGSKNRTPCISKEEKIQVAASKLLGGHNHGDVNISWKRKPGRPKGSKNKKVIHNGAVLNKIPKQNQEHQMPVSKIEEDLNKESSLQVGCLKDSGNAQTKDGELLADIGSVQKRPRGRPKKLKDQHGESDSTREGKLNGDRLANSGLSVSSLQFIFTT